MSVNSAEGLVHFPRAWGRLPRLEAKMTHTEQRETACFREQIVQLLIGVEFYTSLPAASTVQNRVTF